MVQVTPAEEQWLRQWIDQTLGRAQPGGAPFSFRYGDRPSSELLPGWRLEREETSAESYTVTLSDPDSGLRCHWNVQTFSGFPAVEWVLRFRNDGTTLSPLLEDVQALHALWPPADGDPVLHRSRGSTCRIDDFAYLSEPLPAGAGVAMAAGGGRSSSDWLPFFNLQMGQQGVVIAIGWTGQWAACFQRDPAGAVVVRAGMELTRLRLQPGEEIRTPRILLLFWEGEPIRGHNLLRRFLLAHHSPAPSGRQAIAPIAAATWGGMRSSAHLERIRAIREHNLPYDYYWIDAGWYGPPDSHSPDEFEGDWALHVGNWQVNPAAHPAGLRPLSDAAREAGMKFLLWVEPERAIWGTPLTREHPDWFLGEKKPGASVLFNLGLPEARRWLTDFVSGLIVEHGLDCYRQDFNIEPLSFWRSADPPDRQGITEIRHVEGLYAFWDELLRRHPHLLIDNCASGGRRIDLETVGRGIPLWRSDYQCWPTFNPTGSQAHTCGLAHWVPLSATGTHMRPGDTYNFRSALSAGVVFSLFGYERNPIDPDYPWDWHRARIEEFRRARPFFYGDYYPLTPCTTDPTVWLAYQMHRPDLDAGFVLAFRRERSPYVTAALPLRGLVPGTSYTLQDADAPGSDWQQRAADLADGGLRLTMEAPRQSRLIFYHGTNAAAPRAGEDR